jgi:hypothetical protein
VGRTPYRKKNDFNMCDVFAKLMLLFFYAFNMDKFMTYYAFAVKIRSWGWVNTENKVNKQRMLSKMFEFPWQCNPL